MRGERRRREARDRKTRRREEEREKREEREKEKRERELITDCHQLAFGSDLPKLIYPSLRGGDHGLSL